MERDHPIEPPMDSESEKLSGRKEDPLAIQERGVDESKHVGKLIWLIIAVSLSIHALSLIAGQTILSDWRWPHHPVHASIEISGALIAFLVAATLVALERRRRGTSFNVWITGALIGMGTLDAFHAMVHVGNTFVWLHSTATLVGGILFSLVWLPGSWAQRVSAWWHWGVFGAAFTFGLSSILFSDLIPAMVDRGKEPAPFTGLAQVLNVVGGVLLFVAAFRLVRTYFQTGNRENLLFCLHCSLFGAAAIMFEQSELWDVPWWGWHLLRLMAYVVAFWFVMLTEQRTERQLASVASELENLNRDLESRVDEMTKELRLRADELELQRQAALNLAEDCDDARQRAEEANEELKAQRQAALSLADDAEKARQLAEQIKEKLARSNTDLEQFAYVASHDLQEPLRAMSGFCQLLKKRYEGKIDATADDYIQEVVAGAERMQQLIMDLLDYSRVGRKGKPFEPTDCKTLVEQALSHLRASIEETNAQVRYDGLPTLNADPLQLAQVFQNLISNAIKFRGDETPNIQISAERRDGEWLFSIRDKGIGIDPKFRERIFVIFQRLHTREQYPGTGIGLAICKRIIDRHGGRIWVESEPGKGSNFFFTIHM